MRCDMHRYWLIVYSILMCAIKIYNEYIMRWHGFLCKGQIDIMSDYSLLEYVVQIYLRETNKLAITKLWYLFSTFDLFLRPVPLLW